MANKVLNATAVIGRNELIWQRFIENYTQAEIAEEFGIAQQRVSQIVTEWAQKVEETPREALMRARFAQVDRKISELEERQSQDGLPHALYLAYSTEIRRWFDFRARLRAEYAPARVEVGGDNEPAHIVITGADVKALR